jgi:hypothetical protein
MVKYKIIYTQVGRVRGENYTGKTHTKQEVDELLKKHEQFENKFHTGGKVKVVKVSKTNNNNNMMFFSIPKVKIKTPRFRF